MDATEVMSTDRWLQPDDPLSAEYVQSAASLGGQWPQSDLLRSAAWCRFCEDTAGGQSGVVVARDSDGGVCATLPLFVLAAEDAGRYGPAHTFVNEPGTGIRVAIAGPCAGYRGAWSAREQQATGRVVARLMSKAAAIARERGADILTTQYLPLEDARLLVEAGLAEPWQLVLQDCEIWLELAGRNFEQYIRQLSSGRRATIKRDLAAFGASNLTVSHGSLHDALGFASQLFANIKEHHGQPLTRADADAWFRAQDLYLGQASVVLAAKTDRELPLAYSLSYEWGEDLYVRTVGMDYERAAGTGAYFQVAYYATLRYAAEHDLARVHLGIGALRPKLLRGGTAKPLYGVFWHRDTARLGPAQCESATKYTLARLEDESGGLLDPHGLGWTRHDPHTPDHQRVENAPTTGNTATSDTATAR
jgi:hypothetical protein